MTADSLIHTPKKKNIYLLNAKQRATELFSSLGQVLNVYLLAIVSILLCVLYIRSFVSLLRIHYTQALFIPFNKFRYVALFRLSRFDVQYDFYLCVSRNSRCAVFGQKFDASTTTLYCQRNKKTDHIQNNCNESGIWVVFTFTAAFSRFSSLTVLVQRIRVVTESISTN